MDLDLGQRAGADGFIGIDDVDADEVDLAVRHEFLGVVCLA